MDLLHAHAEKVEKVRADLRGWNLGRAMFVADSGMYSADNRSELAKACGKYLLACRMDRGAIRETAKCDGKWGSGIFTIYFPCKFEYKLQI